MEAREAISIMYEFRSSLYFNCFLCFC